MKTEPIKRKYESRIREILERARQIVLVAGHSSSAISDLSSDDYRWALYVGDLDSGKAVDFTVQICESDQFDGTDDGINFSFDIVEYGGRMLGGITPMNYTDDCWVALDNPEAIEARFKCLEDANYSNLPEILAHSCVAETERA